MTPNDFADVIKMKHTGLWGAKFAWCSPKATLQIYFYGLEHSFRIHAYKPTWPCSPSKTASTISLLNCNQPRLYLSNNKILGGWFRKVIAQFKLIKKIFRIKLRCTFICATFRSDTYCNTLSVSAPTTTILPTTAATYHILNCLSLMIYAPQTNMCY